MNTKPSPTEDGLLEKAARTIGSALGTVVVKSGVAKTGLVEQESHPSTPRKVNGRFQKTGKTRTPRKEKKLAAKKAAKKQGA